MMFELRTPLPVVTPLGDGYVIYITNGGMYENDIFTIVLEEGGYIKHFRSDQIKVHQNLTYDIKKKAPKL
jgi:hypothetical protein